MSTSTAAPRAPHGCSDDLRPQPAFVTTRWSVVLTAGASDTTHARDALAKLCEIYWYPLYAYVRQRGYAPHDAQDLTQEFFARLLKKNTLRAITREKGKFRSFLLTALNHFLVDEWKKARAQKRGGGQLISLDAGDAETRFGREPVDTMTPEKLFDQNWALALLDSVFDQLQREYEAEGRGTLFKELKHALAGARDAVPYAELAVRLNIAENTVKTSVHRLRKRYRELLRLNVAHTVADANEVEEELRTLFRVLTAS